MSESAVWIVLVVIVGGGIAAIVAYNVARARRGSIEVSLPSTAFKPGDVIAGSFELHAKQPIEGRRLVVSLIGTQVTKTREDGKTRSRSSEIFREEKLIEDAREYPAEHRETHPFEIEVPDAVLPEQLNSPLGKALASGLRFAGASQTHLRWRIEARLVAKGIDLIASRRVSITPSTG